jgi:site-specific recombinase XerD
MAVDISELLFEESMVVQTIKQGLVFFTTVGVSVKRLSQRTQEEYARDLGDLASFLAGRGVADLVRVRLRHLQLYQHGLARRGLSPSSCNRKTDAIKTFFRFLREQEVLRHDPAEQLIPPLSCEHDPRILTEEEYNRLLTACAHHRRDTAIIVLYLQSGMRLSELVRLKLSDVELPQHITQDAEHAGFIRITRSRGSSERIPLNYKACQALLGYLTGRPAAPSPTLFLNRFEQPLSKRRVQYLVKEYLERIGIFDASVHTLRHTMAAHHIAQGTDLQVIQETLGISLAATEKYVSLAKKTARRALQEHAL